MGADKTTTESTIDSSIVAKRPDLTVVVPTYREAENIPELVSRIGALRVERSIDIELILVDDNSSDGTPEVVRKLNADWVRLIVRTHERGLATAVLHGLRAASSNYLVSMDADLSHPPEVLHSMLVKLYDMDVDFVIGSRYVVGGSTDDTWGIFRWMNSKVATLLARPFTNARDPMAGFFGLRRETFEAAPYLNPIGYKIALELIVKCACQSVHEVPIHFADRKKGASKLNFTEQINYLRHIKRLSDYKYGGFSQFAQFALVGAAGTLVNLLVLTILNIIGVPIFAAVAVAILLAMGSNFVLNRLLTFASTKAIRIFPQFLKFSATCSAGAFVNYWVTMNVIRNLSLAQQWPQLAALIGIVAGLGLNFIGSKFWVFRLTSENKLQDSATTDRQRNRIKA